MNRSYCVDVLHTVSVSALCQEASNCFLKNSYSSNRAGPAVERLLWEPRGPVASLGLPRLPERLCHQRLGFQTTELLKGLGLLLVWCQASCLCCFLLHHNQHQHRHRHRCFNMVSLLLCLIIVFSNIFGVIIVHPVVCVCCVCFVILVYVSSCCTGVVRPSQSSAQCR